jgi:hypothetical protein
MTVQRGTCLSASGEDQSWRRRRGLLLARTHEKVRLVDRLVLRRLAEVLSGREAVVRRCLTESRMDWRIGRRPRVRSEVRFEKGDRWST